VGTSVSLQSVSKAYGTSTAVSDVSLDVEAGEFVSLLGASGSGKTTLLRMIAGYVHPDSGSITLNGKNVTNVPVHKRDIGMVFQNYALFPHLSVRKNVAFPLEMRKISRTSRAAAVEQTLSRVRLQDLGARFPHQLSGGQQQRVAFARAIVFEPSILLMDEPLGALDKNLREALQLEIMGLSRDLDLTVIYVTHDQSEAFTMSDRIALLGDGIILQCDAPRTMYESPLSVRVATFVGEANLFVSEANARSLSGSATPMPTARLDLSRSRFAERPVWDDSMVLVVRPEDTWIRPAPAADTASGLDPRNTLGGTVSSAIFAGHETRISVDVGRGRGILVRTSLAQGREFGVGAPVTVGWDSERAVITTDVDDRPGPQGDSAAHQAAGLSYGSGVAPETSTPPDGLSPGRAKGEVSQRD
jgi:putative spermidine/putrescine transport system ATP-binding protein